MATIKKTFDDTYGKHALVHTDDSDKPAFGRTDVMHLVPWRMHPSRAREDYRPTHMKKIIAATVAAAAAVTLTGCVPTTPGRASYSASPTLEAEPVDPYSSDGQWLVPDEIQPGNYRVSLRPGKTYGYGAVCGDYECDPFGEPGMLSNDNYSGPGVMVVPQSAVMVELNNITLTPMSTRP